MRIENVRLVPNISVSGHLVEIDEEVYWVSVTGEKESLNLAACNLILVDKLSSTALITSEDKIKMLHFLNGDVDKFADYLVNRNVEGFCKSITGPYIQFRKQLEQQEKLESSASTLNLDEATVNVLDAFAKVPLMAKELLSRLRGEPQNLHRPRGISNSIPVNPWIREKPLNLPKSRIKLDSHLDCNYESLPDDLQVKAVMIYNSGGKLIKSAKDRADFWELILKSSEGGGGGKGEKESFDDSSREEMEHFIRIEKDLNRLGEKDPVVLERLKMILQDYCKYDPEVGYVQGMSDLALPFAKLWTDHKMGFNCFCSLMRRIRNNFLNVVDGGITSQLNRLRDFINEFSPLLGDYLKFNRDSDNLFFTYRWLLILFRREFPTEESERLWDVMLAAETVGIARMEDYRIFMALAMILKKKPIFMETCVRFEDLLKYFNDMAGKWNLDELIEFTDQLISLNNKNNKET